MKYSNQRRGNPRRVQASQQSGANCQEDRPTSLTSSTLGMPLSSLTSMSQLNINAAVFQSSISMFQLETRRPYPIQKLLYSPNLIQDLPGSVCGQNDLPEYFPGFGQGEVASLGQMLSRDPFMESIGFQDQQTPIGFLETNIAGFPNQATNDQGTSNLGYDAMPRAGYFYQTNKMITPHAS